ncbi:MAG: Hsp20/alpha crystallin family protein [Saprospiraceae bacterium]
MTYKMNPAINNFRPLMELENLLNNAARRQSVPKINILKTENGFNLRMAIPGLKKEMIKINIEDSILKINSTGSQENEDTSRYIIKEFDYSNFSSEYKLSEKVDTNKIDAEYTDGILMISLPYKIEEKIIKSIELN